MAYEFGNFDTALAAAAGNDAAMAMELRRGYAESIAQHVDLLSRARCDANWVTAAARLRSLAAGFHDDGLMELAQAALMGAPGEPTIVRDIENHLRELRGSLPD
ncbi:Hpt domain-containing protein [Qipengyuania sp. MTN3-11]|uniref:Hpt domain-containing protein n=1 Tax=Qipengyuania sp. MTN3-11 TaxID=3056557 RepID=UPI0036F2F15B